jgi:hypothetical protein
VLEEEVVRLEEQVVNFRQGLYQEGTTTSSLKNAGGEGNVPAYQPTPSIPAPNSEATRSVRQGSDNHPPARPSLNDGADGSKQTPRRPVPSSSPCQAQDDRSGGGKEKQSLSNTSSRNTRQTLSKQQKAQPKSRTPAPDKRGATPAQVLFTLKAILVQ